MTSAQGLLPIGQVAQRAGLRASALRYYEEAGLCSPEARVGGKRYYRPEVLTRLALIALLREMGFSIAEIAELVNSRASPASRWRDMATGKLRALETHIERAREAKALLESSLQCGCGDLEGCKVVEGAGVRRSRSQPAGLATRNHGSIG